MNENIDIDVIDDVEEIIIRLLEDKGYSGTDLINKLINIQKSYENKHIKRWIIENDNKFSLLKDTIWFNFEHKIHFSSIEESKGLKDLKYLGSRFPYVTHLFESTSIIDYIYLSSILTEIDKIIDLWKKDTNIYLAEIYADEEIDNICGGDNPSEIIIFNKGEHPSKYCKDCINRMTSIVDSNGNNQILPKKNYVYCVLTGPLNQFEQTSIYFNLLVDLRNTIISAIQYHKSVQLVISDYLS